MAVNLWHLFEHVVMAVPDRDCIAWRNQRWSYQDVHERALNFGRHLRTQGLGSRAERADLQSWECGQSTVALLLLNGPEYLETMLGAYAARAVPFNVNFRYVADELAYVFRDARPELIVYHRRFGDTVQRALDHIDLKPILIHVDDGSDATPLAGSLSYESAITDAGSDSLDGQHPDDVYLLYTGGTTGMPKGTIWRHDDIWQAALGGDRWNGASAQAIAQHVAAGKGHRFLPNAPFMHGAAQWIALRQLFSGGVVVINDVVDRVDPSEVWATIEREQCDCTLMVGDAVVRPLLAELEASSADASSLRLVMLGGVATSDEAKARLARAVPQAMIVDVAGSSETGAGLSAMTGSDSAAQPTGFTPAPGAAVLDSKLDHVVVRGQEEIGWFAKTGPIPLGYLGDPAKTADTFREVEGRRWSIPGDRATWTPDGRIVLLGRESTTINTGGEKVFAEEVEAILVSHPDVTDALVVGRPSELWGDEVAAIVSCVPGADLSASDLAGWVRERLAGYKVPKRFSFVDTVHRNPAGKPDYRWARQLVTEFD